MEVILGIKKVSLKLFSSFNGRSIGYQERVCQTLQLHKWRVYWWSRTCISNSLVPPMEGVLVIKNVSVKLFSSCNRRSIGYQERVCQTLQIHQWMVYWWSRTCLSNSLAPSMEGVLVIKNVSVKLFNWREYWWSSNGGSVGDLFINGGSVGDQECVCQTLQLLQWREYWWSRTCLPNSSASSMETVLVIKNVSVKFFCFFNLGSIGDQERVCQTLQLLLNGGSIGVQGRVCQIIRLHQWREYWWWRTCLSIASANFLEGVLVIKNWPVKLFSIFNGGIICDQKRVSQTLLFLQRRENW